MAMYEYAELHTRVDGEQRKARFIDPDGAVDERPALDSDARYLNWFAGFGWRVVSAQRDDEGGVAYLLEKERAQQGRLIA